MIKMSRTAEKLVLIETRERLIKEANALGDFGSELLETKFEAKKLSKLLDKTNRDEVIRVWLSCSDIVVIIVRKLGKRMGVDTSAKNNDLWSDIISYCWEQSRTFNPKKGAFSTFIYNRIKDTMLTREGKKRGLSKKEYQKTHRYMKIRADFANGIVNEKKFKEMVQKITSDKKEKQTSKLIGGLEQSLAIRNVHDIDEILFNEPSLLYNFEEDFMESKIRILKQAVLAEKKGKLLWKVLVLKVNEKKNNKEIAEIIGVSTNTVSNHYNKVKQICQKIGHFYTL